MFSSNISKPIPALIITATLIIAGCGGSVAPTPTAAAPTPSAGSANPAPTPSPTPAPTPAPQPGSNADMFQAALMKGDGEQHGELHVNSAANNGAVSFSLTAGPANTSLTMQFCPFNPDTYGKGGVPCYDVDTFTTDASGNSQGTFTFPKTGVMFGNFRVMQGTNNLFESGFAYANPGNPGQKVTSIDFHASLQRADTVRDVDWGTFTLGHDQITSGNMNIHGSIMTVQVTGAVPSSTYVFTLCPGMTGSGCYDAGSFTTDVSGSASTTIDLSKTAAGYYTPSGETFYITRGSGLEYIAGFKVD